MVDFLPSEQTAAVTSRVANFLKLRVAPAETLYETQRRELVRAGDPHGVPAVIETLKASIARTMRMADGPGQVHLSSIARAELR